MNARRPASASTLLIAAAVCLALPLEAAGPSRLALHHYLELEQVEDPRIAPDGSRIVYTRRWIDKVNDRWRSGIWVMGADGSRGHFLVEGSAPRWSPDGTRIAYVADGEPAGEQIWVRWMDAEGGTTQITRVERAPRGITWSPDGESIAFVERVPRRDSWKIDLPEAPEKAKWTEAPRIIQTLDYRQDRVGFVEDGFEHVFVVPASGGTARQLTSGDFPHARDGELAFTADGAEILFSGLRVADWEYEWRESEIYAVAVADGTVRQVTRRRGPDGNPAVSPDGKLLAYTGFDWTDDTYVTPKLWVARLDGTEPRRICVGVPESPGRLRWAADGRALYFDVAAEGSRNLWRCTLAGAGEARQVTSGAHMLQVTDLSDDGVAVGVLSSPQQPGDVVRLTLSQPEPQRLTSVNDDILHGVELSEVEEIRYASTDGLPIQGWLVKPPGFDPARRYPLMLSIHGGPHGMYHLGFNFGWQEHAANGYLVLYTNPRGSSGYGDAFGNQIKNAYPGKDYDDLMRGVDEVIARGFVDESRMFVYGCSGGGVLTAWVVGHTDRFAAASSNCPVTNWLSFVGTTDGPTWYRNFAKPFWEDPSEHLRRSPIMYVGNVTTPTMLMTGVDDLRTPISQTEEYYQALKMRRVPTAMLRFNGEYHGTTSKPSNFLRTQLYLRYWFEQHAPPPAAAPAGAETTAGS